MRLAILAGAHKLRTRAKVIDDSLLTPQVISRFWSNVDKTGECWLWTGSKTFDKNHINFKYGQFMINGKNFRAHRLAYFLAFNTCPSEFFVCHTCDNPSCVNPNHLFLGTHLDNVKDMCSKNRQSHYGSINHLKGEECHWAKLNEEKVLLIKELREAGLTCKEIGKVLGLSQTHINAICLGKYWKHLNISIANIDKSRKLTPEDARQVVLLCKSGENRQEVANKYDIHERHLRNILSGKYWGKVTADIR